MKLMYGDICVKELMAKRTISIEKAVELADIPNDELVKIAEKEHTRLGIDTVYGTAPLMGMFRLEFEDCD